MFLSCLFYLLWCLSSIVCSGQVYTSYFNFKQGVQHFLTSLRLQGWNLLCLEQICSLLFTLFCYQQTILFHETRNRLTASPLFVRKLKPKDKHQKWKWQLNVNGPHRHTHRIPNHTFDHTILSLCCDHNQILCAKRNSHLIIFNFRAMVCFPRCGTTR